jgi:two-component system NtrC family response regulator
MAKILVVDDDALVAESILNVARGLGHDGRSVPRLADGLDRLRREPFDLVFLDVQLPDGSGLAAIEEIQRAEGEPEVIIITGFGHPDGAEQAIRSGAWDYLTKPLSVMTIRLPLERAIHYREKKSSRQPVALRREGIIGESPRMRACLDGLAQAAGSEANVLITGETGTGKELFAWAVHKNSRRSDRDFVIVDCAALPETLVESTLFGHVKGAFTGADAPHEGLIKQADGGTLFLDEIGELPLGVQKAFLRVLQEKRFRPVGGGGEVESDFRLIAATNRDLALLTREGRFREDLLYRLRTLTIDIPPLREHPEDIRDLTLAATAKLCQQYKIGMKGFSAGFWSVLDQYDWPGNVRELIQALEKSVLGARDEPMLFAKHLPQHVRVHVARAAVREPKPDLAETETNGEHPARSLDWDAAKAAAQEMFEREYLTDLLRTSGGRVGDACRLSGLSRARLYALLKKNGIKPHN